jgi:hypothetical protein
VETRDWNPFPWLQVARKDFSGVAQSERRFFTHDENLKKYMMVGGGGEFRSCLWNATSTAGEAGN